MTSCLSTTTTYMMLIILVQHHSTSGSGFSCDFGTLDSNTGTGLHDCDVTQVHNSRWQVISGNDYLDEYWLDSTWKKNGGFFISWSRDQNDRSLFRLPRFQMSTAYARLSFIYKFFGTGRSRLRVRLCNDVIFDVTNKEEAWIKSPDLFICCYEEGWNWPEIRFEVIWNNRTGRIAVDAISLASMASVKGVYGNNRGSCEIPTTRSPTTTSLLSPTMHLKTTKNQTIKSTALSTSLHPSLNGSSTRAHVRNTEIGSTASFHFDVSNVSNASIATPTEQNGNIDIFDLVKTFPINLAFLFLTASLVIVVVVIVVCLIRKHCCKCRSGSKPVQHRVSLGPEKQDSRDESTYQSMNEPSQLPLPVSELKYTTKFTGNGSDMTFVADGVYVNMEKPKDDRKAGMASEDPHIYSNFETHGECGAYIELETYENVCG